MKSIETFGKKNSNNLYIREKKLNCEIENGQDNFII